MPLIFFHLKNFCLSARPKTLTASLSPVLLAAALAAQWPQPWPLALLALCALLLQVAANLVNDYYDVKRGVDQQRIGPTRALQRKQITPHQLKCYFMLCFALALLAGLGLAEIRGAQVFIPGTLCLLGAYCYTGGPWPLSHHMLGEMMAFIFFGPMAVLGSLWVLQGGFYGRDVWLSLLPGFIAALMMGLNNQRDARTDALAGKRTLAVRWGEEFARSGNLVFLSMTLILPPCYVVAFDLSGWILLVYLPFFIFIKSWVRLLEGAREQELIAVLSASGQYFFLYHLCLAIGSKLW